MAKKLTWCNGYRYGNRPITPIMARIILRQMAREAMQCQRRAFQLIMKN